MSNDKSLNPIEQIRDIVFGQNMTSYEERFQRIESLFEAYQSETESALKSTESDWNDRLKDTNHELLEKSDQLSRQLAEFKEEFTGFRSDIQKSFDDLKQTSLSRSDFSEALIEMSFRFAQDDGAVASSGGDPKTSPSVN